MVSAVQTTANTRRRNQHKRKEKKEKKERKWQKHDLLQIDAKGSLPERVEVRRENT